MIDNRIYFPAEWHKQVGVMITFPHLKTDWEYMIEEAKDCFLRIAKQIASREILLVVAPNESEVEKLLSEFGVNMQNVRIFECETNDTWARDHAFITLLKGGKPLLLDFCFNGWGKKFSSDLDNKINISLFASKVLSGEYVNCLNFVLEGGSVESDGRGTLLTTSKCLLAEKRNDMSKLDIECYLKKILCVERVLWLDYGDLEGDDTDGHIDTLARFCSYDTIAYVQCEDEKDSHFHELRKMEQQLMSFRTLEGKPYKLLPLPMVDKIEEEGERLPATYANFLIMNTAVLMPSYNQPKNDARAREVLQKAFPDKEIVMVDCRALIKQHGSLHCVTMQFPKEVEITL
ncbi:MAG: agmatine deiminase family protein [Paludibacteraceae bacterium]|nr:agmatine deiminase family protein [Paludibacteraceae bacterium]